MKLTFLGHASWMVQSGNTTLVTDLLVENLFRNGTFTICPTRELVLEQMPKLDALIITHRHRDHFDLETLVRMDRGLTIFCPNDRVILRALERLHYKNVVRFDDWSTHELGDLSLVFTPSDNRVPENGVLISDSESTFWNHVDTVVNSQTIELITDNVDHIDLVAHGYQAMLETAALQSLSLQFPYDAYAGLLHRARLLKPRAIAPGSNGYRTYGTQEWFNAYKFPVSRERFVRDIQEVLPATKTFIPNPGDVMELRPSGLTTFRQGAQDGFVRTVKDDAAEFMAFNPGRAKPALVDVNPNGVPLAELRRMVHFVFETRVPVGCNKLGRLHTLRHMGAILEIRVAYPDNSHESWVIDLSGAEPRVALEHRGDDTDYVMEIGSSGIYDFSTGMTRPDIIALSGQFRLFSRSYRLAGGRLVRPSEISPMGVHRQRGELPWLLFQLIGHEKDFEGRQVEAELDRLLADGTPPPPRPLWERSPLPTPKPTARPSRAVPWSEGT